IATDRIQADPDQPREEFDEEAIGRLASSLRSQGVLQPIRVRWHEGRGFYVIIAGERRWRAARMAGIATLPCVVDDRPLKPSDLLVIQIVENALRQDLKPIEQAKAYRTLMDQKGWSIRQLADELSIDFTAVAKSLGLLKLPGEIQEQVEAGDIAQW